MQHLSLINFINNCKTKFFWQKAQCLILLLELKTYFLKLKEAKQKIS